MDPTVEKLIKLPPKQKILFLVVVVLVQAAILMYFLYLPKHKELSLLKEQHSKLQAEVDEKTRIANNLPKLQKEYNDLNIQLERALTELPNSKEIPSLLTSITSAGKGSGLDFIKFRPLSEIKKDFYAEVPVDITVSGTYISVANFFASVSNLPRIVNITNVDFSEVKNINNRVLTKVNCVATTFRFLGKDEISDNKNSKQPPK